ncbi:MAG TPA: ribonuclease HII [Bacillota bacterium]|nr:ribonuclease HII [Bacillota bacterium]
MMTRRSVQELRDWCLSRDYKLDDDEVRMLASDPRVSVQRLASKVLRSREVRAVDEHMLTIERSLWTSGYTRILGMDEVGRGSLAGPVCVGGVIFSFDGKVPSGIRDSKSLSPGSRAAQVPHIIAAAVTQRVVCRDSGFVDRYGIIAAIADCQRQIITDLEPDYLLLDGFALPVSSLPQQAMEKGDSKSASIAAASILAKEHRDQIMRNLCPDYPEYCFSQNKGYGSSAHIEAVRKFGPCAIHRMSFLQGVLGNDTE